MLAKIKHLDFEHIYLITALALSQSFFSMYCVTVEVNVKWGICTEQPFCCNGGFELNGLVLPCHICGKLGVRLTAEKVEQWTARLMSPWYTETPKNMVLWILNRV